MMYLNTHNAIDEAELDEEEAIKYYFNGGLNYQEILLFLSGTPQASFKLQHTVKAT